MAFLLGPMTPMLEFVRLVLRDSRCRDVHRHIDPRAACGVVLLGKRAVERGRQELEGSRDAVNEFVGMPADRVAVIQDIGAHTTVPRYDLVGIRDARRGYVRG